MPLFLDQAVQKLIKYDILDTLWKNHSYFGYMVSNYVDASSPCLSLVLLFHMVSSASVLFINEPHREKTGFLHM